MLYSLLLILATHVTAKECYAVTMQGGGACGSYEAGVVMGMYNAAQNKDEYRYDVVSGVSAGSINAALMSIWAPG